MNHCSISFFRTSTQQQRTAELAKLKERLNVLAPKLMNGGSLKKLVAPLSEMAQLNPNGVKYSFSVTALPQVNPYYSFLTIHITDGMGMGATGNPGLNNGNYPCVIVSKNSATEFSINSPTIKSTRETTPSGLANSLSIIGQFLASYAPEQLKVAR